MKQSTRLALALAALVWMVAVFAGYYYTHKPITVGQVAGAGGTAVALAAWVGTLALAHWLGRLVAPWTSAAPPRERLAYRVGLGLGVLGLFMLAVGFVGLYRPALVWALLALGLTLGLRGLWHAGRAAWPALPAARADRLLAAFVLFSLGAALVVALAPAVAWDSLVYHLTGPKLYIAAGRVHHDLDLPYLGFPQWPSMLYTWALLSGGAALAQLLHLTCALLALLLVPGLTARLAPGRGWLAGALLLSAPGLVTLAAWPYAEWFTLFAVTAAFASALRWHELGDLRWLATAGAFVGLALGSKYTALGALLGLGAALAWMVWERGKLAPARMALLVPLLALACGAALAGLPWLLKNWILTGNPLSPFALPGKFWDPIRAWWFGRFGSGPGLLGALSAPWTLMVDGGREEDVGPLLLALLPLLALGWHSLTREARRVAAWLLLVVGVAAVVWLWGVGGSRMLYQYRLFYPVFALVAVLAAAAFHGLGRLSSPQFMVRWVAGGLVALALLLNAAARLTTLVSENPLAVALGLQSREANLEARLGLHYSVMQAINRLPAGGRVLFLWEPRAYYCEAACQGDTLLDNWWHPRQMGGDAHSIADDWRGQGFTHVLLHEMGRQFLEDEGFDPYTEADWAELERLKREELTLLEDFAGAYQLYRLKP